MSGALFFSSAACFLIVINGPSINAAKKQNDAFLGGLRSDHLAQDEAFRIALSEIMGCGDAGNEELLRSVNKGTLLPIWSALPKSKHGRVEWPLFRYMLHRYFMQQYSVLVRGLEPSRVVNITHTGATDMFKGSMPTHIEDLLKGKGSTSGFSLDDAVLMIATLEQLMKDEEAALLQHAYSEQKRSAKRRLNHAELAGVVESYMAFWMVSDDLPVARALLKNRTLLQETIPLWDDVSNFAKGLVKTVEFDRERSPRLGNGHALMEHRYSFEDARVAVGSITRTFASFWETECQNIKASLVALDKDGSGRIPLSDFYGANAEGEWRFGESESYLRELGALDESSSIRGKQVIIPNYLHGANNCIVSTANYLVCCINECEEIMNDIEDSVGGPVALPEVVLPLVGNMTNWNDDGPEFDDATRRQLQHIAQLHGGRVPLHGRLFAQWLHYVFPRECPFPHLAGQATAVSPLEFGDGYIAPAEQIASYAANRNNSREPETMLEAVESEATAEYVAPWMTQWSEEEELIADYSMHLWKPTDALRRLAIAGGASSMVALLWAIWVKTMAGGSGKLSETSLGDAGISLVSAPGTSKTHFV